MFNGSIPAPMRSIVRETARTWPTDQGVWVPCAGNFTIERSMTDLGFELHSCDVSIYTSVVGKWLAGEHVDLTVRAEAEPVFGWLQDGLDGGVGSVATIMLATRFLGSAKQAAAGHPYHARLIDSYRRQWANVHAKTVEKLAGNTVKLASYDAEDVTTWLDKIPPGAPLCSFPPFYGGGYETLYAPLEAVFDWAAPEYKVLTDDDVVGLLGRMTDRPHWLTASNHDIEELRPYLRGRIQTTPRAAPFYVYAAAQSRLVAPNQKIEPVRTPRIRPGDTLTGELSLAKLTVGQFNALRSKYLNSHIAPGSAAVAFALLDAGRVVGVFAVSPPKYEPGCAYLLSDFPVAPVDYKHLAKLVVLAATSKEATTLFESALSMRLRHLNTTAFSNNPVSMKYRGVGKLTVRNDSDDPNWKFTLNYRFDIGSASLVEVFERWAGKWGAQRDKVVTG